MKKEKTYTLCFLFLSLSLFACHSSTPTKEESIETLRESFAQSQQLESLAGSEAKRAQGYLEQLSADGKFLDLAEEETKYDDRFLTTTKFDEVIDITNFGMKSWERLRLVGELCAMRGLSYDHPDMQRLLKGIINYGHIEVDRDPRAKSRFHGSCFLMPQSASALYFLFYDLFNDEMVCSSNHLLQRARVYLEEIALQAWTQPYRNDATDDNYVSVERFRGHVWWVGGNALGYRPLLEAALIHRNADMIDVLQEVAIKSFSSVSQATIDSSFWIEGITADGAGWGHGRQCLVWGYPIDGMNGAFKVLKKLEGTLWETPLTSREVACIMDYVRGSSFYHNKGVIPPVLDRSNMVKRTNKRGNIPSMQVVNALLKDWRESLPDTIVAELEQFKRESTAHNILLLDHPRGAYHGTRYFYNNDDVIKKDSCYYLFVNMASSRVDGLESAPGGAASYNYFANDGVTLFEKEGMELRTIMGAMDQRCWPGVTSRLTESPLKPIMNWSGYSSAYNYAGAAVHRHTDFAAGFVFLKVEGTAKKNNNYSAEQLDTLGVKDMNPSLFGVRAYKSYFLFDNIFLAMGSGVENLKPEIAGDIVTTIEQSYAPKPIVKRGNHHVVNNHFQYLVLPQYTTGRVEIEQTEQVADWKKLSTGGNRLVEQEVVPLFKMVINHGKRVTDATYAYVVAESDREIEQELPRVLQNTPLVQAAENHDGKTLGAVIYQAGESVTSTQLGTFTTSHPAVLFVKREENSMLAITLTDPTYNTTLQTIEVTTTLPVEGARMTEEGEYLLTIELPQGEKCGSPTMKRYKIAH